MKTLFPALTLVMFLSPCNLMAQDEPVIYFNTEQMDAALQALSGEQLSVKLGESQEHAPYLVIKRAEEGRVEIHEQYDDVAIIRSGSGMLKTGLKVTGQKVSGDVSRGEWIGGEIQNATERQLSPGDFIVIQASRGHQYIPTQGDTLTYWTIKVKRKK